MITDRLEVCSAGPISYRSSSLLHSANPCRAFVQGACQNNVKHGKGKMQWASGDVYDGDWNGGVIHGGGTFTYADGGVYTGEWENDKRHGQGSMKHANGDTYAGQWVRNTRHGQAFPAGQFP